MSELENCCGTTCDKSALAEELSKLQQLNAELELAIKTKEAENKIFFMAARNLWNAILLGKDEDLSTLAVLLKASIYTLDLENRLAQHDREVAAKAVKAMGKSCFDNGSILGVNLLAVCVDYASKIKSGEVEI